MIGVLILWVKINPLDEKFSKNPIWTKNYLVGNNECQFKKSQFEKTETTE